MIVERVELENFMCYADNNTMEFKEGINVIIGDNGYGKSQLYNAFYWVMYDQIFVKERDKFVSTRELKSIIISDKAKAIQKNGNLSAKVRITFHNLERDNIYILERKYTVDIHDGKIHESNDSEFTIMEKDLSYLNARMVNDEEQKKRIKDKILPEDLKPYLWFQGEQVESIIDFNKHDSLARAINVLSNIKRYDELKNVALSASKAASNEYDRELRRLSKDVEKSEQLEIEKDKHLKRLETLLKEEGEINDNLSRSEARCEELLNKINDAQKVSELQERKKGLLNQLADYDQNLKQEQISFHRKMFRNKWVLKGTEKLFEEYSQKFSKYEQKRLLLIAEREKNIQHESETEKVLQTRLPFNVPEPNYVQWMLDQEKCLVCDRVAEKESTPWKKIKELLDRPEKNDIEKDLPPITLSDFSTDFKRLYQSGLSLSSRIEGIDEDINETLKRKTELQNKVRDANARIQKIDEDIQRLLSDTSMTSADASNILNEYSIQNKKAKDFKDEQTKISTQISVLKNALKSVDDQLSALVTGEIPQWLVEKRDVLNDFNSIAESTRERVFNKLITQLENEANVHYEAMTAGNKSARGQIKLRKLPNGNYMPEIRDNEDKPLLGSNTSNLILVKLAAIMAIISAKSNAGVVDFYTLITDAPTSVFGEDYTIGYCKTISRVYRQSIIMSKEFYKNQSLKNELLTNSAIKIGKVYMITPSIPEGERTNRNNLSTNIEPLN